MKNLTALLARRLAAAGALAMGITGVARAQTPPSPAAARTSPAASAGQRADTATVKFDVDGLRVILRRNTATDVVAANLYMLGGTRQLTPYTQGIELLLLAASERGTEHFPGEEIRAGVARLGSSIGVNSEEDWSVLGLRAIRSTFDSTWTMFADRVMYPTLATSEVELVRTQLLGALSAVRSHPDEELEQLADSLLFSSHPYALTPKGTVESMQAITVDQLRQYQKTQMVKSRMLLVVVGNVDRPHLEQLLRGTLARLPQGSYTWQLPPSLPPVTRDVLAESRSLPTNYIMGYYAGPRAGTPDYQALRIATAVLSGRFFTEIRSRRNLTYAVDAPFVERAVSAGGVYVTTVAPEATLTIMRREIDRLQRELIDPDGLQRLVQQFITDFFLKNETNADQANFLARAELYEGDYREANAFVDELRRVTPEDVRSVAREYMKDFRFVYLGDTAKLPRELMSRF